MSYFNKSYHPPGTPPGTLKDHQTGTHGEHAIRNFGFFLKQGLPTGYGLQVPDRTDGKALKALR